jgi:hypothetical protein
VKQPDVTGRGGEAALKELERFFMGEAKVHQALHRISEKLSELNIPYAVAGGMALNAPGFRRATDDVGILVTPEGLQAIHAALEGLGYLPPFKGSKQLRDVESSVRIEFLLAGQFPGDGKPKPVAFPDPAAVGVEVDGIRYLNLETLIELKLASGMTNEGRLKDLGDVQELIRTLQLQRDFGMRLHEYVRDKYYALWDAVANSFDPRINDLQVRDKTYEIDSMDCDRIGLHAGPSGVGRRQTASRFFRQHGASEDGKDAVLRHGRQG